MQKHAATERAERQKISNNASSLRWPGTQIGEIGAGAGGDKLTLTGWFDAVHSCLSELCDAHTSSHDRRNDQVALFCSDTDKVCAD